MGNVLNRSNLRYCLIFSVLLLIGCSSKQTDLNKDSMASKTLLEAVEASDLESVITLLKDNPSLEVKNKDGETPLMKAVYNQDNELAIALINAGADVNAQDKMLNSPFLYAGAEGNLKIVKEALKHGANFGVYNRYGGSALIPAAEKGHLEVVKILVNTPNFPKDHINNLGWTALLEAVILSDGGTVHVNIIKALIAGGCNVNIADKNGVTSLAHAKKLGYKEMIKVLEQANAK
ncbi:ankyrin repeat domain-containing protein [Flavobacterium branchiarum]|uniref:Ankyrin repeat domain-containing protein n=1 Tax=Flavobacterium branchiarum TaxID=1114870 RepID=A0ABV5FRI4_9FLAO|nr:ankyrin repeat domain-containing protein [Flavobacterium branchiarum]MDN3672862.1 ankyrin repeat domain-containing protein [Flavobacterium branchiarum]